MKIRFLLTLLIAPLLAAAQQAPPSFTLACPSPASQQGLQKQYCETRDLTLPAPPAGTPLTVDARPNGSITVRGWSGTQVRVRARVDARSASLDDARALAKAVRISSGNNALRAARANGSHDGWSVSYEVLVPTRTNLTLDAVNGGVTIENVHGTMRFTTVNGPLELTGLGGDVRGKTTNGGLRIVLTGPGWEGPGFDLSTVNGGVTWQIPATYSATLLARTTHGRITAELPTARKQLLPKSLTATLGKGGAQLRVSTVNGGVTVQQPAAPEAAQE